MDSARLLTAPQRLASRFRNEAAESSGDWEDASEEVESELGGSVRLDVGTLALGHFRPAAGAVS